MKKVLIVSLSLLTLNGCALTELARDYLNETIDTNQYEYAKDIDDELCDPDVLVRLKETHSDAWYAATIADCKKRDEDNPLVD